jgi:hypothetical protein
MKAWRLIVTVAAVSGFSVIPFSAAAAPPLHPE